VQPQLLSSTAIRHHTSHTTSEHLGTTASDIMSVKSKSFKK